MSRAFALSPGACDVTLREGLQSGLPIFARPGSAAAYVSAVLENGWVREAEIYRPGVHISEQEFSDVIRAVGWNRIRLYCGPMHRFDDAALRALPGAVQRLSFTVVRGTEDVASRAITQLRTARPDVTLRLGFECAGDDSIEKFVAQSTSLQEADSVAICDSAGRLDPDDVVTLVHAIRRHSQTAVEGHFHNDRGLALANWRALRAEGGSSCDVSLAGLGERNGVLALETVLAESAPRERFPTIFDHLQRLRVAAGPAILQHSTLPFTLNGGYVAGSHRSANGELRSDYADTYFPVEHT